MKGERIRLLCHIHIFSGLPSSLSYPFYIPRTYTYIYYCKLPRQLTNAQASFLEFCFHFILILIQIYFSGLLCFHFQGGHFILFHFLCLNVKIYTISMTLIYEHSDRSYKAVKINIGFFSPLLTGRPSEARVYERMIIGLVNNE
ncbi:hypothetical protein I7I50_03638 [Histoplasma capsulatum G186AR]|uniref:Uncharacterized protein n=1 Tax=Ajellomyces capsulatus TaxID=5037 RepID=A0A8H7YPH9_AJECA|nr:hypothetical protein I7I52_04545 [Histoplasma capsulatum]QSS74730.1 hypothetical protein I7I50_03638 [Histoplasma capsulatum G186AR]